MADSFRALLDALPLDEQKRLLRDELLRRAAARSKSAPFAKYVNDWPGFARDILRLQLWELQEQIGQSVIENTITAAATGQKVGKTKLVAGFGIFWVHTRTRALVIQTSGNMDQVEKQIWMEVGKILANAPALDGLGTLYTDPSRGYDLGDGRMIIGLTARDAERMAGYSSDELLVEVDEASGFDDRVFAAVRGNLLGGGRALLTGNPTKQSGFFFDYHTTKRDQAKTFRVDSRENPNYVQRRKVIPGLATYEAIKELEAETGGDGSPIFDVRVAGRFPEAGSTAVVGIALLEKALLAGRTAVDDRKLPLRIGVDVARFGDDDSVIQPVRGKLALPATVVHGFDIVDVAGKAMQVARSLYQSHPLAPKPIIAVDTTGLGAGVADILRRSPDVQVADVDAARNAIDEEHFHRLRDQLWWSIRTWIAEGGALPPDSKRDAELLAAQYGFDERSRVKVESKDSMRKRINRSPDRADALAMAVSGVKPWSPKALRMGSLAM